MVDAPRVRFAVLSLCAGLFVAGGLSASMAQAAPVPYSKCTVSQLSLGFDDEGGAFNGMSQSGTLLVLRNIGIAPCQVRALPHLHFEDADGHAVDAVRRAPPGMHPGPVLSSVQVMPDAELTARLHWVSGDVYDGHHCISPATAVLDLPGGALRQAFGRHMCAPAGSAQFFDQAPLRPDPVPPTP
ncbi:DUF4232 domain-containing protein [Nguyenibacter sp. L1]|uniref:DUF4232 domain-containing protein n=1 Tax=Nguyenibacter sp. L1 TaxID=3049350 RepID=UPI002B4A2D41|nr:DUF4232 domain-containing protein [Nguyenibacter sp. L1]WRH86341.1 DUF4232 domain-containing protein [Nguyenibacter sp. L1]